MAQRFQDDLMKLKAFEEANVEYGVYVPPRIAQMSPWLENSRVSSRSTQKRKRNPKAVEEVLSSFSSHRTADDANEVFVQPLLENTSISGVMMTRDYHRGAPTCLINFDDSNNPPIP